MNDIFGKNVIDITHHSKRTQAGNLQQAGVIFNTPDKPHEPDYSHSDIPQNVTLERAIEFFKNNAEGKYQTLYTLTAHWLEEYHAVAQIHIQRALEAQQKPDDISTMFNPDSDEEDSVQTVSVKKDGSEN